MIWWVLTGFVFWSFLLAFVHEYHCKQKYKTRKLKLIISISKTLQFFCYGNIFCRKRPFDWKHILSIFKANPIPEPVCWTRRGAIYLICLLIREWGRRWRVTLIFTFIFWKQASGVNYCTCCVDFKCMVVLCLMLIHTCVTFTMKK